MSRIFTDKVAYHEDWKDGMNAFRLKMWEELIHLQKEINKIKQQIKGEPQ